jgi:hypothetical protein
MRSGVNLCTARRSSTLIRRCRGIALTCDLAATKVSDDYEDSLVDAIIPVPRYQTNQALWASLPYLNSGRPYDPSPLIDLCDKQNGHDRREAGVRA